MLGTLQKLSLKRKVQTALIKNGCVEWLISLLGDKSSPTEKLNLHTLTDYALEYSTALLMNLCLRSQGRKKAADAGSEILLTIITELLVHDDIEVRPYANGILYATLQDKRVWDEAHEMKLGDMLQVFSDDLPKNSNGEDGASDPNEIRRQFDYIQKQLRKETPPKQNKEESDDEDDPKDEEEEDIIEPDLDSNDLTFILGVLKIKDILYENLVDFYAFKYRCCRRKLSQKLAK